MEHQNIYQKLKIDYLKKVLGISIIFSNENIQNIVEPKTVFLVSEDTSTEGNELLLKISATFPIQPVQIIKLNKYTSSDQILNQLNIFGCKRVLIFGEELFNLISNSKSYFQYMNEPFNFFTYQIYSTHDIEDLVRGSNVDILKRQVWKQVKDICRKL